MKGSLGTQKGSSLSVKTRLEALSLIVYIRYNLSECMI